MLGNSLLFLNFYNFPTPLSLGVFWNVGFLVFLITIVQMVTGVFLSSVVSLGTTCLESKMNTHKEVYFGWLVVNLHSILPSFLFFLIYVHILKSLMFPVYSMLALWVSGVLLFCLFVVVVFTGYSLVSSSMGYWALVVACELVSFLFGSDFSGVVLFYSDSGISDGVMYKMFTLHYLLSFLILGGMGAHLWVLHSSGSSGFGFNCCDSVGFNTILLSKDLYLGVILGLFMVLVLFFNPEYYMVGEKSIPLSSKDFVEMNVEWYLSIFFVLLSSLDSKSLGVMSMFILVLLVLLNTFFKGLWGIQEGFMYFGVFLVITLVVKTTFFFFSSSMYSICVSMVLLLEAVLETLSILLYSYSYLPISH